MNDTKKKLITGFFLLLYTCFFTYSFVHHSQWMIDNTLAFFAIGIMYISASGLKLTTIDYSLFNLALLTHNLGTFGFYEMTFGIFAYDNIVHFVSAFVAAWITYDFLLSHVHINVSARAKKNLLLFFAFSIVMLLGMAIELSEFIGGVFLGEGEGLLFIGPGDDGGRYVDTMTDVLTNLLGTLAGVLLIAWRNSLRKRQQQNKQQSHNKKRKLF